MSQHLGDSNPFYLVVSNDQEVTFYKNKLFLAVIHIVHPLHCSEFLASEVKFGPYAIISLPYETTYH